MTPIGRVDFEFPCLCKYFGFAAVRRASINHSSELKLIEGFLELSFRQAAELSRFDLTVGELF